RGLGEAALPHRSARAILRRMGNPTVLKRFVRAAAWLLATSLIAVGCGPVADVIGDRKPPTPTSVPFSTATPGGRLSVWLVTPTGQFSSDSAPGTPAPGSIPGGNPVGPAATATAAIATIQAATQIAAAPPPAPNYQPS